MESETKNVYQKECAGMKTFPSLNIEFYMRKVRRSYNEMSKKFSGNRLPTSMASSS